MPEHETRKCSFENPGGPDGDFYQDFVLPSLGCNGASVRNRAVTTSHRREKPTLRSREHDVGIVDGEHGGIVSQTKHKTSVDQSLVVHLHPIRGVEGHRSGPIAKLER